MELDVEEEECAGEERTWRNGGGLERGISIIAMGLRGFYTVVMNRGDGVRRMYVRFPYPMSFAGPRHDLTTPAQCATRKQIRQVSIACTQSTPA